MAALLKFSAENIDMNKKKDPNESQKSDVISDY